MSRPSQSSMARWPVFLVLALLAIVTLLFLAEFVSSTQAETIVPEATSEITADTYVEQVTTLLQDADPANGASLIEQYECVACHRLAVANNSAPPFVDVAERAATRRPPLTAAAYIYELIVHPAAFVVAGYNTVMPQNFRDRLSDRELGDIIAYLLTPDAH